MEHNDGAYEQIVEQKLDEFIIQNQTPYQQDNFDGTNTNFVENPGNDNQPVSDNVLNNSQSAVDNSSNIKTDSVKESEQIVDIKAKVENPIPSSQTETGGLTEMSVAINELISEAVSEEPVKESEDKPKNHVTEAEEKVKPADSNDTTVNSNKDADSSPPLPESSEKVNCLKKDGQSEPASADSSNVLQSDDVAVLAEFGTMNYQLQEEVKSEAPTKPVKEENSDEVIKEINEFLTTKPKSEEKNVKTEKSKESPVKTDSAEQPKPAEVKSNDTSMYQEEEEEEDLELQLSADQSTDNHRKVLQDIFADWQDENGEEDAVQSSTSAPVAKDPQDAVEMELQSLLSEEAHPDVAPSTNTLDNSLNSVENSKGSSEQNAGSASAKAKNIKLEKSPVKSPIKSPKSTSNSTSAKDVGQSPKNPSSNQSETKKFQSPRPGVKVPGSHLTSQIATTAEVNEVLKERLKEKQKDLQNPKTADVVFVKKMSQRLSSQLAAAAVGSAMPPPLQPAQLPGESNDVSEKAKSSTVELPSTTTTEQSKPSTDNNDLLAILEGDVDPDWSNLKPHGVLEENNKTTESHSSSDGKSSSKLDPATERELALKQLLELPSISSKKKPPKKAVKPGKEDSKEDGDVINISSSGDDSPKHEIKTPKQQKENNSHNTRNSDAMELSVDESRSGRKRKLTEKAREHELSVKRQKVIKGKPTPDSKKDTPEVEKEKSESSTPKAAGSSTPKATGSSTPKAETPKTTREPSPSAETPKSDAKQKKPDAKQPASSTKQTPAVAKDKETPAKRSSIGLSKKDTPIAKRKLAVKSMLRQKKAAAAAAKTKASSPEASAASSTSSTTKSTPEKSTSASAAPPKEKKKTVTEIDRLLQDEGVVNMLYDAEQPDSRKRLVPITKSQKKVMDVDKAERELKFRKKMVKNAVLRLRNSGTATTKVSPRSRRNATASANSEQQASQQQQQSQEKKSMSESSKSSELLDFILPTKMRNAADASRIIRRHSSSSFSSTSASPRVSIDQPPESLDVEELEMLVKNKRKTSHDSTADAKRGRKKSIPKSDTETKESDKSPARKEKLLAKKVTRSSASTPPAAAVTVTKAASKNKKGTKSGRASVESSPADAKSTSKGQDELSACLAEAASALLSNSSSATRSSGASAGRKKGSANVTLNQEDEQVDTKKLFSNKEISVRYHGHLVQLILTPSVPASGIRNALTIQAMNEFRDALSILRKDDTCRVVLFTSTGTSFCEGLELSSLLHQNLEERKVRAKDMAVALKEFLRCLASFNKPIVAGVQGAAIGLGVTMLPLFDLVIASDKATFSTPYGKLGQMAEGTAVLALSRSLATSVTNELLLGGRVLTASEALRAGLVTRVLWPDRFQGELLPSLKTMSEQSARSMEATKAMLRHSLRENFDKHLDAESCLLVQHWVATDCQEAMKAFIEEKGQ